MYKRHLHKEFKLLNIKYTTLVKNLKRKIFPKCLTLISFVKWCVHAESRS